MTEAQRLITSIQRARLQQFQRPEDYARFVGEQARLAQIALAEQPGRGWTKAARAVPAAVDHILGPEEE